MSIDFVAIDFETANGFRGSACAVGLVKVIDGVVVQEYSSLIRPPRGVDAFDARNVRIHGIRPEDVQDAPGFPEVFAKIRDITGDLPFVAHNAAFDMGVIRSAVEAEGMGITEHRYACTVLMSRKFFTLPSHSLPFAAQAAGHRLIHHHDALNDARACAAIAQTVLSSTGFSEIGPALESLGVPLSKLSAYDPASGPSAHTRTAFSTYSASEGGWLGAKRLPKQEALPIQLTPRVDADPGNPLYGQGVIFTGRMGLSREEAKYRAAECGARPMSVVGPGVNILVVGGGFQLEDLESEKGFPSQTFAKVMRLREKNMPIEIVTEGQFMQCVRGTWPESGA